MHPFGIRRNSCSAQCCLASFHGLGWSRDGLCLFSLLRPTTYALLNNSDFLGNLNVHNLCHKPAYANRNVEEIQTWKVILRAVGWEKRKGFDFRELKAKQSQRNSPKCKYNSCIKKSDCVLCLDNCCDREARKPFYISF